MAKTHERRTERANAEEVAEIERQLWEFAKRIDPPTVPEAKLRPGAFLWRIHRTWHSLGGGTGGLASRSFRALRDELLKCRPPVKNLQPKLYGSSSISRTDASNMLNVFLQTWNVTRNNRGLWQIGPLTSPKVEPKSKGRSYIDTIQENLLRTLFKGDENLFLEEPIGVLPELFLEERGRRSLALILPTKSETIAQFSPSIAHGAFSGGLTPFFKAAAAREKNNKPPPLLIWVLRLRAIRDNAEFHQAFHAVALHAAALTNWYFRLSRERGADREQAQVLWDLVLRQSAFAIYGLPEWCVPQHAADEMRTNIQIDEDLTDLEPNFFVPNPLPVVFGSLPRIKRQPDLDFSINVSIEPDNDSDDPNASRLSYWLLPDQLKADFNETAETTGLPVFNAEISPGADFDRAYQAVYDAVRFKLGFSHDAVSSASLATLLSMGWRILSIEELQQSLVVKKILRS